MNPEDNFLIEEEDLFNLYSSFLCMEQIDYWIGNPSVELITGTIFFEKNSEHQKNKMNFKENLLEIKNKPIQTNVLIVAPIPINKNFFEFADFIQKWEEEILELRIIQTSLTKSYGVLICFHSNDACQEFYLKFQGKPFNDLEPYLCLLKEVIDVRKKFYWIVLKNFLDPTCL